LTGIDAKLARKLARVGLTGPRLEAGKLGSFLREYIDKRTDVRPNTKRNLEQSRRYLGEHFGEGRAVRSITAADADGFGFAMKAKYAEATAARVIKHARQFFTFARRGGMVEADPFAEVKPGSMSNEARLFFIDRTTAEKVLAACPDAEWRLIIALARYGGLRTPSEPLALTWEDVKWDLARLRIDSPKTGERWIPLFPELRPLLEEAFDRAEPGTVHVITRYRKFNQNLRTQFTKIIRRAGLKPWPRPFQNLRASRETELAADHPLHVVTEWIGNSAPVAARHYLSVTDADFEKAARKAAQSSADTANRDSTQLDSGKTETPGNVEKREVVTVPGELRREEPIPLTGVEPVF